MTIFLQIIGWYCLFLGLFSGIAIWSTPIVETHEMQLRRGIVFIGHVIALYADASILMH